MAETDLVIDQIINVFRKRASKAKAHAKYVLLLIYALIVLGVILFVNAGNINSVNSLQQQVISGLEEYKLLVNEKLNTNLDSAAAITTKNNIFESEEEFIVRFKRDPEILYLIETDLQGLELLKWKMLSNEISDYQNEIKTTDRALVDERLGINLRFGDRSPLETDFVRNSITRLATIVLIFIFIKFLVPQYRFKTKLHLAYQSKLDALELIKSGELDDRLEPSQVFSVLAIDINFDKEPELSLDKLTQLRDLTSDGKSSCNKCCKDTLNS